MAFFGRDLKDHQVPIPCHRQDHQHSELVLDQAAQGCVQPEHLQGWSIHSLSRQPVPAHFFFIFLFIYIFIFYLYLYIRICVFVYFCLCTNFTLFSFLILFFITSCCLFQPCSHYIFCFRSSLKSSPVSHLEGVLKHPTLLTAATHWGT